jgi:hypothetical protein
MLSWSGSGMLKGGTHPLHVTLFPSSSFSRLRLDGLRPTCGLQGSEWLCASRGVVQYLKLSGTV